MVNNLVIMFVPFWSHQDTSKQTPQLEWQAQREVKKKQAKWIERGSCGSRISFSCPVAVGHLVSRLQTQPASVSMAPKEKGSSSPRKKKKEHTEKVQAIQIQQSTQPKPARIFFKGKPLYLVQLPKRHLDEKVHIDGIPMTEDPTTDGIFIDHNSRCRQAELATRWMVYTDQAEEGTLYIFDRLPTNYVFLSSQRASGVEEGRQR
jgi:hypothetical protein